MDRIPAHRQGTASSGPIRDGRIRGHPGSGKQTKRQGSHRGDRPRSTRQGILAERMGACDSVPWMTLVAWAAAYPVFNGILFVHAVRSGIEFRTTGLLALIPGAALLLIVGLNPWYFCRLRNSLGRDPTKASPGMSWLTVLLEGRTSQERSPAESKVMALLDDRLAVALAVLTWLPGAWTNFTSHIGQVEIQGRLVLVGWPTHLGLVTLNQLAWAWLLVAGYSLLVFYVRTWLTTSRELRGMPPVAGPPDLSENGIATYESWCRVYRSTLGEVAAVFFCGFVLMLVTLLTIVLGWTVISLGSGGGEPFYQLAVGVGLCMTMAGVYASSPTMAIGGMLENLRTTLGLAAGRLMSQQELGDSEPLGLVHRLIELRGDARLSLMEGSPRAAAISLGAAFFEVFVGVGVSIAMGP